MGIPGAGAMMDKINLVPAAHAFVHTRSTERSNDFTANFSDLCYRLVLRSFLFKQIFCGPLNLKRQHSFLGRSSRICYTLLLIPSQLLRIKNSYFITANTNELNHFFLFVR